LAFSCKENWLIAEIILLDLQYVHKRGAVLSLYSRKHEQKTKELTEKCNWKIMQESTACIIPQAESLS